ncbi:MAG: ferredoxin--NADP reductase, partial [Gammaproteobacteria bacterium]|nr:ferredoxin--NADP reductase [Gammaproteobacteria bacterium]
MTDWLQGRIIERKQWNHDLFSLRFEAPLAPFKAGQFVLIALDIDGVRIKRPYSLVNAPHEKQLEIYFNVVSDGPLSPRLATLDTDDILWVSSGASGLLVMDEIPQANNLWLLATGTGIGPFLSLLKTEEPWMRFQQIVLGHSVRQATELAYNELITFLLASHVKQLHYVPIVTRETLHGALAKRLPLVIASGELEALSGISLDADNSHVILCGNAAMIGDVTDELGKRGLRRHRRREPGHI